MKTRALPPHAGVDLMAVLLTSVICLVGLSASLEGKHWMLVAGVGLTIGAAWSLLMYVLRGDILLAISTLPLVYVGTAGAVALGSDRLIFGLPDGQTLGEVVTGTVSAWRRLAETAPPVDSDGIVLLIPFVLTVLLSGLAMAMALSSRRPVLPMLPLLLMLGILLVLGMQDPVSVLGQGVGFGIVALGWVAHRGNRGEVSGRAADVLTDPALTRVPLSRLLVSALMVIVAAGAVVPFVVSNSNPDERWLLREAIQPYDSESIQTPLSAFRIFREGPQSSLANQLLFTVKGAPRGARVRLAVLDAYDGKRWIADSDRSRADFRDRFLRVSSTIENRGPGSDHLVTVKMKRTWDMDWLPMLGRVQGFQFYEDRQGFNRSSLRYNRSTGTALLPTGLWKGEAYLLDTRIAPDVLRPSMSPWPHRDERLWKAAEFLDVPVQAWSIGAKTPMQQLLAVATRMRERGRYSDGAVGWETKFASGQDQRRLDDGFINAPMMVGNDEQYAATMALLSNRLGIPARVVVGARVRPRGRIRGTDVSAWVEVRIANGSWRILPTDRFMSHRPPRRVANPLPPVTLPPPEVRPTPNPSLEEKQSDPPVKKREETRPKPADPSHSRAWWLFLVPFLLLALIAGAKSARRRIRRSVTPVSRRYAGAWNELLDTARDLGLPTLPTTRPRQARALAVPAELAREADVATFSEVAPAGSRVTEDGALALAEEYWEHLAQAQAELSRGLPAWRRALARVNPASLLPRSR